MGYKKTLSEHQALLLDALNYCLEYFEKELEQFAEEDQGEDEYLYGNGGTWEGEEGESLMDIPDPRTEDEIVTPEDEQDGEEPW